MEKAGIYVYDDPTGKDTRYWRGQHYDEIATFTGSGIGDDEVWAVYKNSGGHYLKANGADNTAKYVVGFCDRVTSLAGYVVSSGYFSGVDTSGFAVGEQLWLHDSTLGTVTNTPTDDTKIKVGTVITVANPGIIDINIEIDARRALEEAGIFLDYTDSNFAFRGQSFDIVDKNANTAFSGVSAGDVVYFASDGNYKQADDNGTVTAQWVGIADTARNRVYTSGYVTEPSGGTWPAFTAGQSVYLSETAGAMTTTPTDIFLGYAISTNVILLKGSGNISITQITDASNIILNTAWDASVSDGDIVYWDSTGPDYNQATDAGTPLQRSWVGIADKTGGKIFTGGTITATAHGFTIGTKVYLSTAGAMTSTKTNTVLGIATTANQILLAERQDDDRLLSRVAITAAGVSQYEAVYINSSGHYEKALSDGTAASKWVGIATQLSVTPGTSADGIIVLSGIVVLNDTILPDGTFNDGDEVFLNADGTFGNTQTSVKIGDVLDSATWKVILATGGGAGGAGDITSEDIQINNWFISTPFNEVYYDTFVDLGTFDVTEAGVPTQDTVTFTNGTDIVNLTAHKLVLNDIVQFTNSGGALPAELSVSTDYYVVEVDADDFKVSDTVSGSAIDFTDDGTGTHYIQTLIQYDSANSNYYTPDVYGLPWASKEILNNNTAHVVDTAKSIGDEVVDARTANKWIWECVNVNAAYGEADTGATIPTAMNAGSTEPTKGDRVIDNAVTWEAIRPATLYRFQVLHNVDDYTADAMKVYYSTTTSEPGTWSTGTNWTEITDLTNLVDIPAGFTDLSIGFEFTNKQSLSSFAVGFDYNSNVYTASNARLLKTATGTAYSVDDPITIPENGRYTADGKSLRVYLNGLKMIAGASADYIEDSGGRIITWKRTGGILTTDDLEFTEDYGLADFSAESWNALQLEHNSSGEHNTGLNGQKLGTKIATTELTGMSGASVTATDLIPAGSVVLGVTLRVTTTITGSTSFTVGDGSDVDAWGTGITQIAGDNTTGADFTIVTVPIYAAVTSVVLTSTGGSFTAGAVRLTVHYMDFTAATS